METRDWSSKTWMEWKKSLSKATTLDEVLNKLGSMFYEYRMMYGPSPLVSRLESTFSLLRALSREFDASLDVLIQLDERGIIKLNHAQLIAASECAHERLVSRLRDHGLEAWAEAIISKDFTGLATILPKVIEDR